MMMKATRTPGAAAAAGVAGVAGVATAVATTEMETAFCEQAHLLLQTSRSRRSDDSDSLPTEPRELLQLILQMRLGNTSAATNASTTTTTTTTTTAPDRVHSAKQSAKQSAKHSAIAVIDIGSRFMLNRPNGDIPLLFLQAVNRLVGSKHISTTLDIPGPALSSIIAATLNPVTDHIFPDTADARTARLRTIGLLIRDGAQSVRPFISAAVNMAIPIALNQTANHTSDERRAAVDVLCSTVNASASSDIVSATVLQATEEAVFQLLPHFVYTTAASASASGSALTSVTLHGRHQSTAGKKIDFKLAVCILRALKALISENRQCISTKFESVFSALMSIILRDWRAISSLSDISATSQSEIDTPRSRTSSTTTTTVAAAGLLASRRSRQLLAQPTEDTLSADSASTSTTTRRASSTAQAIVMALDCFQGLFRACHKATLDNWTRFLPTSHLDIRPSLFSLLRYDSDIVADAACAAINCALEHSKRIFTSADDRQTRQAFVSLAAQAAACMAAIHVRLAALLSVPESTPPSRVIALLDCASTLIRNCSYIRVTQARLEPLFSSVVKLVIMSPSAVSSWTAEEFVSVQNRALAVAQMALDSDAQSAVFRPCLIDEGVVELLMAMVDPSSEDSNDQSPDVQQSVARVLCSCLRRLPSDVRPILERIETSIRQLLQLADEQRQVAYFILIETLVADAARNQRILLDWTELIETYILPFSADDINASIRTSVLDIIAWLDTTKFASLPEAQSRFLAIHVLAIANDLNAPAEVRAAGFRALGVVASFQPMLSDSLFVMDAMSIAVETTMISLQSTGPAAAITGSSADGAATSARSRQWRSEQPQQQQQQQQQSRAANISINNSQPQVPPNVRSRACWAIANLSDGLVWAKANVPEDVQHMTENYSFVSSAFNSGLASVVQGDERMRVNGLRTIGNMIGFASADCIKQLVSEGSIGTAVAAAVRNTSAGPFKVRWNACHAMAVMLSNHAFPIGYIEHSQEEYPWTESLIRALCNALHSSRNFKVRISAGSALNKLTRASQFGKFDANGFSVVQDAIKLAVETAASISEASASPEAKVEEDRYRRQFADIINILTAQISSFTASTST